MKDQTKIIAALLVGAAAGAALGILLAPESGDETRKEITDFFAELIDATKEKAQAKAGELKEYGTNIYNSAKSKISDAVSGASEYGEEARDKANQAVDSAKGYAEEAGNNAKAKVKNTADDWNNTTQNA